MRNKESLWAYSLLISSLSVFLTPMYAWAVPPAPYKYRVTQQLCQQLAVAFGEARLPKLTLTNDSAHPRIAQFVAQPEAELFLDEKLYDICRGFGPDSLAALAIVLGHELAHYYGKHADWFGFAQLASRRQPTLVQAQQTQVLEAQADMQGVYRAFLAGYDSYRLVAPLYTAIYTAYHLPDQMTGYPNRAERTQLADAQARKASTLGIAFDTGLFFLLKSDYAVAQRCFEFVAEEMPMKEVLTNIAVCQLLRVAQATTLREIPFRYPFEVETANRLPGIYRGDDIDKAALLKQAVAYCRQAIDLDETYTTAYINQAAALSMLGRTGTAKETIDQLEEVLRRTRQPLPPNARMLRGIALVEAGNSPTGLAELEHSTGAYALAYNQDVARQYTHLHELSPQLARQVLMQIASRHAGLVSGQAVTPESSVGTVRLPLAATVALPDQLVIPEPGMVRIQSGAGVGAALYRLVLPQITYEIIHSRPGSLGKSGLGIRAGDSVHELTRLYGTPARMVVAANGLIYYCYDAARFFVAAQDGVVRNWFLYTSR